MYQSPHFFSQYAADEQSQLARLSLDVMAGAAAAGADAPWAVRSHAASLVAEVARRAGGQAVADVLAAVLGAASTGPAQAELAALAVAALAEDGEGLGEGARRAQQRAGEREGGSAAQYAHHSGATSSPAHTPSRANENHD